MAENRRICSGRGKGEKRFTYVRSRGIYHSLAGTPLKANRTHHANIAAAAPTSLSLLPSSDSTSPQQGPHERSVIPSSHHPITVVYRKYMWDLKREARRCSGFHDLLWRAVLRADMKDG